MIRSAVATTSVNRHVAERLSKMRNDNILAMAEALTRVREAGGISKSQTLMHWQPSSERRYKV
ncbi:hypothetical protein QEH68_22345 (plasmid) [Paenarthrobacter sp. OM7]|uniref:hypothetical protein n=1 Tax=Paenarthrobacter sp. OM7 TaxID=3041264 RepID=UPI002468B78E|nr:hypothetical protein [Paenarthrobacter sp. OM7]WGM22869.1 hypothetical protein QEH68_22345 [Paenarthrobacter sp. OM7]